MISTFHRIFVRNFVSVGAKDVSVSVGGQYVSVGIYNNAVYILWLKHTNPVICTSYLSLYDY